MKLFSRLLLVVSLALNGLIAVLFFTDHRASDAAPAGELPATRQASTPVIDSEAWQDLQSDDLPTLVSRLRASNFPPQVIRAIIAAEIEQTFAERRRALMGSEEGTPFWKDPPSSPQQQAELYRLSREQQKRLRELLGDDDPEDVLNRVTERTALAFLSQEKADAVRQLLRAADERRAERYAAGGSLAINQATRKALDKELHDSIAGALTPDELLEYDLRRSSTATSMREQLSAFNPTEEEFRAIYKLQAVYNERFGQDGFLMPPEQRKQYEDAAKQLRIDIKNLLGPDRGAEYERDTDYNYRRTDQLVSRLELPPETTASLWTVKQEFEKRRNELYSTARGRAEQDGQLTALYQEAITRVAPMLGDASRIDVYKQYGGSWLQNLTPRPPTPSPAPK